MMASGVRMATAVTSTTATRTQGKRFMALLGPERLLPLVEELEPLGLVEVDQQRRAHRDGA